MAAGEQRSPKGLFEIGGQWLDREVGRPSYYRYWYDAETRRVRRRRLKSKVLEDAKRELAQIVLAEPADDPLAPENVLLSSVFTYYLDNQGAVIRSRDAAAGACRYCLEFMEIATGTNNSTVADFTLVRQRAFMRWLAGKGLKAKSIRNYLSTIKAAMNYAHKPRVIEDSTGREREAQMLSAPRYICDSQSEICRETGLPLPKRREYLSSVQEIGRVIDAIQPRYDHIFRYIIIALNTWARPEAIYDLNVARQVNFERGTVDLLGDRLPVGNKHRPLIRLTDNLCGWLLHWNDARPIRYAGKPVRHISSRTFKKLAGNEQFVPYVLRHFCATKVRRVPGWTVSREERAQWIGHVDPEHRQTEWYEQDDPDYLENVAGAIDAIMTELDQHTARSLWAPGAVAGSRLSVVEDANAGFRSAAGEESGG